MPPARGTLPAERTPRNPTPALDKMLAETEDANVKMDRLVEVLTKLRDARKGPKWGESVSSDYTVTFDARFLEASARFKKRVKSFAQIKELLESGKPQRRALRSVRASWAG